MKKTEKKDSNKILYLCHWGLLFILFTSFLGALIWEKSLPIKSSDHILLTIGVVVVFYYLLYRWNYVYETTFEKNNQRVKHIYSDEVCELKDINYISERKNDKTV